VQEWLVKFRILRSDRRRFTILDSISGTIPPNRICLMLGPPGSGKSTLLQALAGKLDAPDLKVSQQSCPMYYLPNFVKGYHRTLCWSRGRLTPQVRKLVCCWQSQLHGADWHSAQIDGLGLPNCLGVTGIRKHNALAPCNESQTYCKVFRLPHMLSAYPRLEG